MMRKPGDLLKEYALCLRIRDTGCDVIKRTQQLLLLCFSFLPLSDSKAAGQTFLSVTGKYQKRRKSMNHATKHAIRHHLRALKAALPLFLLTAVLLCSCANGTAAPSSGAPAKPARSVTVTDMLGRQVTLEKPAERIVALTAADCEIICALGAGEMLAGRGEYCDYPAEVLDVPSVQSGYETNVEQIIALNPDVVFMGDMDQSKETVDMLEKAGIPVIESNADDIAGVYTAIEMIGTVLGKDKEAAVLTGSMKQVFDDIAKAAPKEGNKTVYFEVSPLQYGLWTAGNHTFMNEAANLSGLKNCFEDIEGWAEISEEQILSRKPDYIVTITMYSGEGPSPEEEILSRKGWEDIPAVRNQAILNLSGNELSRPGPRLTDGARMLSDFVTSHP